MPKQFSQITTKKDESFTTMINFDFFHLLLTFFKIKSINSGPEYSPEIILMKIGSVFSELH